MEWRRLRGVKFPSRAPTRHDGEIEIRVSRMTLAHVRWWHSHVQPVIDEDPTRVDRDWNWLLYVPFATLAGGVLAREPHGYTVGIAAREVGRLIPCALIQLVGRYTALDDHQKKSAFVWFMSTAPDKALLAIKEYRLTADRLPKRLGTIAVDVAITHALNHNRHGRVALHADAKGGEALLEWYQGRGMELLPAEQRLPPGPRRLLQPSDGRYCFYTVEGAVEESRALDPLR